MPFIDTLLIAIALAMDAFAVSVASGVCLGRVGRRQTFRLAWHFGLFQAFMPVIGWGLGIAIRLFVEQYAPWIAFGLLGFIGGRMIKEALGDPEARDQCDPTRGMTLVVLSVATSIDALAVGLSLAVLHISVWIPALIIGVVALICTALGLHLGAALGRLSALRRWAEITGGGVLLGLGIKILMEHHALDFLF